MTSKAIARIVPIGEQDGRRSFYAATVNESSDAWEGIKDDGKGYHCYKRHWKVEMLPVEWDGEGLPPVGTECDVITKHNITVRATILFVGDDLVVVKSSNGEQYVHIKEVQFRPIRSARDKAVEALSIIIMESHADDDDNMNTETYIYDAIAAGKIPGVKLDN